MAKEEKKTEAKKAVKADKVEKVEKAEKVEKVEKVEKADVKNEAKKTEAKKAEKSKKVEKPEIKASGGPAKPVVLFSSVALLIASASLTLSILSFQKVSTPLTFLSSGSDGNSATFVEGTISEVVSKVSPSVVSIVTSVASTNFWGQSVNSQAAGTGVIVTADGYVLTNKHVINGVSSISVVLDNGTTYKDVKVAATDSLNDIAFLKINDVSDLSAAKLGDSKTISVGQQVVAIGNALGEYQNSVTSGVVSGTGRTLTATDSTGSNAETLRDMIQTDAAINSGNSGGPLINAAGEVIGINTANSYSGENVGFAIPIAAAKGMLAQLKESGSAKRAYLGVYTVEITPDTAKTFNLPVSAGAYLYASGGQYSAIMKDSAASKAGLKDKDIITAVNGVKIGAAGSLSTLIAEYKPGDTVQLAVIRDGNEIAVNVTLEGYSEK